MKTRTRKFAAPPTAKPEEPAKVTLQALEASVEKPPKLFILPKDISPDARILSLPNSVTLQPARYLACPRQGFYEFTKLAAPKGACRSWLLASDRGVIVNEDTDEGRMDEQSDEGYVLQTPDLFVATPIDPVFLVLPALWPDSEQNYQPFHDRMFLDHDNGNRYVQLRDLLDARGGETLQMRLENRMAAVCRSFETNSGSSIKERHYHLDVEKLGKIIWKKAEKMVEVGLPASLEDKFVKVVLEVPVLGVRREESAISLADDLHDEGTTSAGTSQNTNDTVSISKTPTPATSFSIDESSETQTSAAQIPIALDAKSGVSTADNLARLLRLRTALNFIMASYVPRDLREAVEKKLNDPVEKGVDFQPLNNHLAHITKLRAEAHALRSISDNVSRKRGILDDEEALEKAETKKRKKEEEEAKKRNMSHGVKKLMKANTTGMKKMSSFFAKAPAKK